MTESPDWQALDFACALCERYGTIPVHFIHDAEAAALTDWRAQAKTSGTKVSLSVSAGCGVSSALATKGEAHCGRFCLAAERCDTSIDVDVPCRQCANRGCFMLFNWRISFRRLMCEFADGHEETVLTPAARFASVAAARQASNNLAVAEDGRVALYLAAGHPRRHQFREFRHRGDQR